MPGIAVQAGIHEIGLALAVVLAAWLAGRLLEAVILFVVRHFLCRMVVLIGGVLGLAIALGVSTPSDLLDTLLELTRTASGRRG